jgi:hypothetical protein
LQGVEAVTLGECDLFVAEPTDLEPRVHGGGHHHQRRHQDAEHEPSHGTARCGGIGERGVGHGKRLDWR